MIHPNIISSSPSHELGRTTTPVECLSGIANEVIEDAICDGYVKVQILGNESTRDLAESRLKSAISLLFLSRIGSYLYLRRWKWASGTSGTKYQNGFLLTPDFSIWTKNGSNDRHTALHLNQPGPAPAIVFDCEYEQECTSDKKGYDKIWNYYFHPTCLGTAVKGIETKVKEAWLFVVNNHEDDIVESVNHFKFHSRNVKIKWYWIPLLGPLLNFFIFQTIERCHSNPGLRDDDDGGIWLHIQICCSIFVRFLCFLFYEVVKPELDVPEDPLIPYLVVFYRTHPQDPLYYHMLPNQVFLPPWESRLCYTAPVWTNSIYSEMCF